MHMSRFEYSNDLDFPRPLTMVDVVIFTVTDDTLHVLLVERSNAKGEPFPNMWALPGGIVDIERDTDLEDCAMRKLKEKTGVASPYLEQLGSWGSAKRDPRDWSTTHVYFALIAADSQRLKPGANAADARWFPIKKSGVKPNLAFDHEDVLSTAIKRLRNKVEYTSLAAFLLPREFTLSELQHTYEVVLGRKLEKSAFRTRMLAANLVEPIDKTREGSNRPAQLYHLKNPQTPIYFPRTFGQKKPSE